jgi:hypothetical protein
MLRRKPADIPSRAAAATPMNTLLRLYQQFSAIQATL